MRKFNSERLRSALVDTGRGISDVSRDTGISRIQLYRYLNNEAEPGATNLKELARVTGKAMEYFFADLVPDGCQKPAHEPAS